MLSAPAQPVKQTGRRAGETPLSAHDCPDDLSARLFCLVGAPRCAHGFDEHKSSYSNNGGACVDVATSLPGIVAVRDSKDPSGPSLVFGADSWQAFIHMMKD
jgi:hypothetical protein